MISVYVYIRAQCSENALSCPDSSCLNHLRDWIYKYTVERMGNTQAAPVPEPVIVVPDPPRRYMEDHPVHRPTRQTMPAVPRAPHGNQPACRFYARGTCNYGTSCRFSHDGTTTAPTIGKVSSSRPSHKSCRDFQRGHCARGKACLFSHDQVNKVRV